MWFLLSHTNRSPTSRPDDASSNTSVRSESKAVAPEQSVLNQIENDSAAGAASSGPAASDEQLENEFAVIAEFQRQLELLKSRAMAAAAAKNGALFKKDVESGKPLTNLLNEHLASFQKDLSTARRDRPQDPTVLWLTGELLMAVGGEPLKILPYLQRAEQGGLKRSRLFQSVAKVEFDLNRFQTAYDDASKAVELDSSSREAWESFSRTCFALERSDALIERLSRAFPNSGPPWVRPLLQEAEKSQESWRKELAIRQQEDAKPTLPLVRFVIEHRKFAAADAAKNTVITGQGEVLIELFEDQAPLTVGNFMHLVETGFYDRTTFYWAEPGQMVVGGDPNTKNDDPSDDGLGGPGYTIPDEYAARSARGHFRGTISTVQNGPGKAGSQFFITLISSPQFDGNSTAFGRVIKGQEVLDQITQGRTDPEGGDSAATIPGDLLVRAEVVRKRAHPYVITKNTNGKR